MERRTLIAFLLSMMVIVGYPYLLKIFYPNYGKTVPTASVPSGTPPPASVQGAAPVNPPALNGLPPIEASDLTEFSVGSFELGVSRALGSVVHVGFKNHRDPVSQKPLVFLEARSPAGGIGALRIEVNGKEADPTAFKTRVEGNVISSETETPDYAVWKAIDFSKSSYSNKIAIQYQNKTSARQRIKLGLIAGSGLVPKVAVDRQYMEANWIGPKEVTHIKLLHEGKTRIAETSFIAASIKDRHFSSIVKPSHPGYMPAVYGMKNDSISSIWSPVLEIAPGETRTEEFLLYLGPNDADELRAVDLEQVVNFGKLDAICKLLLGLLQVARRVTGSYGIAIILLTVGLNVLLLPLTRASTLSMKRMQLVQPQVAKIREKYSKDATRMNKEMMDLYKKHKVNPMGGCLPMFLQMPVFISLYVAISKSPELLGAKFLWINDLAYPDSVPLPVTLPFFGRSLHLLPLIMIGAMALQQRISQANMPSADPQVAEQQKMMAVVMPIFFGFVFYPMPSGLVIYWLTNTLTMIVIQRMLGLGKKPELAVTD